MTIRPNITIIWLKGSGMQFVGNDLFTAFINLPVIDFYAEMLQNVEWNRN